MRSLALPRILAIALCLPIPGLAQVPPATARSEVQVAVRAYVDAHNTADGGAIAAMYSTQPGVTSIGDGEIVRGWDRIRERLDVLDQLTAADGRLALSVGSVDVTLLGSDFAVATAAYRLTVGAQGAEVRQQGAMTLIMHKVGGEWKIIHDHTSTLPQGTTTDAGPSQASAKTPSAGATIPIVAGTASEIAAQGALHYAFQAAGTTCTVTGRVEGVSGGNKDFEVMILDDDNYRNWNAGLQANAYVKSGRVTVTNLNAQVPGPGTYHLVISNKFSLATPKTVQVWAQAQCQ